MYVYSVGGEPVSEALGRSFGREYDLVQVQFRAALGLCAPTHRSWGSFAQVAYFGGSLHRCSGTGYAAIQRATSLPITGLSSLSSWQSGRPSASLKRNTFSSAA